MFKGDLNSIDVLEKMMQTNFSSVLRALQRAIIFPIIDDHTKQRYKCARVTF